MRRAVVRTASLEFERSLWARGLNAVYGLDEAGRGAWAGPVYAGAVCLPATGTDWESTLSGVFDSKAVRTADRQALCSTIEMSGCFWGVGSAQSHEVDQMGIGPATRLAMTRALEAAIGHIEAQHPEHLLLDALRWNWRNTPYTAIVGGDRRSLSIAAASILAKTHRDAFMTWLDAALPAYGFARHKGYGTQAHQAALAVHGPSEQHRMSFAPLKSRLL